MKEADPMIVFRGCLFDATRIGGRGRISSRLYYEVSSGADAARTGQVDVTQPADAPYGQGGVEIGEPEGGSPSVDGDRLSRAAAEYYRLIVSEVEDRILHPGVRAARARDVIVSRTWEADARELREA